MIMIKNIHVLPTNKPSRLYFDVVRKKLLLQERLSLNATCFPIEKRNIYITSDEETKEDDWCYNPASKCIVKADSRAPHWFSDHKKIILSTDQDLIKDGVQAIDDEFLEWFVKNSGCESVETYSLGIQNCETRESGHYKYEIIIPKEESYDRTYQPITLSEVDKQETLEEAAYKEYPWYGDIELRESFCLGAKWQQERSYSEEDMLNFAIFCSDNYSLDDSDKDNICWRHIFKNNVKLTMREMFEQFKKK